MWISYSDLSTTLMLSFIFIFLATLYELHKNEDKARKNAERAKTMTREVYEARAAYLGSLEAVIGEMKSGDSVNGCEGVDWKVDPKRNSIQLFFRSGSGWFADGYSVISPEGKECLKNFSTKWLKKIYGQAAYRDKIERLVIEGHSNSKPPADKSQDPYLYNLGLSQDRAYAAAEFIMKVSRADPDAYLEVTSALENFAKWRDRVLTATGRGSADPILLDDGSENLEKSKRIEFMFTIKHDYDGYKSVIGDGRE